MSFRFTVLLVFFIVLKGGAEPFRISSPSEMNVGYMLDLNSPELSLPGQTYNVVTATNGEDVAIFTTPNRMALITDGGYSTPGTLLGTEQGGVMYFTLPENIQGFATVIEHQNQVNATYTLTLYDNQYDIIKSFSVDGLEGQGGQFLGAIDPDSRVAVVALSASPDTGFVVSSPQFQSAPAPALDYTDLTPASSLPESLQISNSETFLHEGYNSLRATPETTTATESLNNVIDLKAHFPALRSGDLLRLSRKGRGIDLGSGGLNHLLGVFSSSETILKGNEFKRVPDAILTDRSYYTQSVSSGVISTPTNISQDFLITEETHIVYHEDARYLFLSRERVNTDATPVSLDVSHIPRYLILDWISELGLHGANTALDSDLDGDGLTLLEEYAFRKDPTVSDNVNTDFSFAPVLTTVVGTEEKSLIFGAKKGAPLRYTVEFSDNLTTWESAEPVILLSEDSLDANAFFIAADPNPNPNRRFSRLTIDYIQPITN